MAHRNRRFADQPCMADDTSAALEFALEFDRCTRPDGRSGRDGELGHR